MFGLFKSKEQKQEELKKKLEQLNVKYKDCLLKWCKHRDNIFAPIRFEIQDGKIMLMFKYEQTLEGFYSVVPFSEFPYDLIQSRADFIIFKNRLKRLGLKIDYINERGK